MSGENGGRITLAEAAGVLQLPVESVAALVGAGYLRRAPSPDDRPRVTLSDVKAFLARNNDDGAGDDASESTDGLDLGDLDPQSLLDALDGRSEDMARRALDLLIAVFPDAQRWTLSQQAAFIDEARSRFEAILAVASLGNDVDDVLIDELAAVGADAARSGSPLHELLLVLRISRDLVVQTAVEVAEERGRHWGLALSLVLTRVLPALDRLVDAIVRGYWLTVMDRHDESQARFRHVVEHSSDGVYEIDLDGRIRYANLALAVITGRSTDDLVGARLVDVVDAATAFRPDAEESEVVVRRPDGVVRMLDVRAVARRSGGELVGYDGVVRDVTAAVRYEELRNELLGLLGAQLRQPLTTVLGLGGMLEGHSEDLDPARIRSLGERIHQQAELMTRLVDDLHEMSALGFDSLVVDHRPVALRAAIDAALSAVPAGGEHVTVDVARDLVARADRRRIEQVVANLVENALRYGAPPIEVHAHNDGGEITVAIDDRGAGVEPERVPELFSQVRMTGMPRRRSASGLGLALVRGLVEAMGGRVWYEARPDGGARFVFTLPAA